MGRISRVFNYVRTTPWAILPARAAVMWDVLRERAASGKIVKSDVDAVLEASERERKTRVEAAAAMSQRSGGMVAVVPVNGTFVHRAYEVESVSGGGLMSSEQLAADLRTLDQNPDVTSVVLDINSPGGSVHGMQELVSTVRAMDTKVVAVANAMAASAAYWLAASADELVITPSGQVGSIGVIAIHEDWSQALENEGVNVSVITTAPNKAEGNPYGPLDEGARERLEVAMADHHKAFVSAVAAGRGVKAKTVESDFGQGGMVNAKDAVKRGMADRVATLEETVSRLASGGSRRRSRARAEAEPLIPGAERPGQISVDCSIEAQREAKRETEEPEEAAAPDAEDRPRRTLAECVAEMQMRRRRFLLDL